MPMIATTIINSINVNPLFDIFIASLGLVFCDPDISYCNQITAVKKSPGQTGAFLTNLEENPQILVLGRGATSRRKVLVSDSPA